MDKACKISKAKGVEMCADLLFAGQSRKEILQHLTNIYSVSESAVDKWMKAARPAVEERQQAAELIRTREMEAAVSESAKRLNLSRERVLEELAKIAFADVRKIFTVDGGLRPIQEIEDEAAGALAGIESYDEKNPEGDETLGSTRKIKMWDKVRAIETICKILGYHAPTKVEANVAVAQITGMEIK